MGSSKNEIFVWKIFHHCESLPGFAVKQSSVHPNWDERCCIRGATQVNAF